MPHSAFAVTHRNGGTELAVTFGHRTAPVWVGKKQLPDTANIELVGVVVVVGVGIVEVHVPVFATTAVRTTPLVIAHKRS